MVVELGATFNEMWNKCFQQEYLMLNAIRLANYKSYVLI